MTATEKEIQDMEEDEADEIALSQAVETMLATTRAGRKRKATSKAVLATNTGIRILFANSIREYLNRLKILHYSNIRVLPEYYSNSTCNVTCSTNMYAKALISEFSTYLSYLLLLILSSISLLGSLVFW